MGTYAFDKKNTRFIGLKFNVRTDADIIERLEAVSNKQQYIRRLIRQDIDRDPATPPHHFDPATPPDHFEEE